jgi:hypothetical protein
MFMHGRSQDQAAVPTTHGIVLPVFGLSIDERLTTTRAVRKRLELMRPVGEDVLGIPYEQVMQTVLIPATHKLGTEFEPAARKLLETELHWKRW